MRKVSSVVFMWIAFGIGVIAVLMMFTPAVNAGGTNYSATSCFFDSASGLAKGAWTCFVGYMLILAATIVNAVLGLPMVQPSAKTEKIVLISSIAAYVIGIVLVMTVAAVLTSLNNLVMCYLQAGSYLAMSFSILCIVCDCVALKLDW